MSDLIEMLRSTNDEIDIAAADEIERLQSRLRDRQEEYMYWCCNPKEAADRIERLEAAIEDALPCLQEHDPEVEAICRAALETECT